MIVQNFQRLQCKYRSKSLQYILQVLGLRFNRIRASAQYRIPDDLLRTVSRRAAQRDLTNKLKHLNLGVSDMNKNVSY